MRACVHACMHACVRVCVAGSLSSSGLAYVLHCSVLEAYKIYVCTLVFYNEHNTSIYICIYHCIYSTVLFIIYLFYCAEITQDYNAQI